MLASIHSVKLQLSIQNANYAYSSLGWAYQDENPTGMFWTIYRNGTQILVETDSTICIGKILIYLHVCSEPHIEIGILYIAIKYTSI